MQMIGLWARPGLVQKLLPETGRAMGARLLQESITLKPGCQMESQHCCWTLVLLGTWLVMKWVRLQAAAALRAGLRPAQRRRERPLTVRGVGQGGEKCTYNCILPVTLLNSVGRSVTGTFDAPTVPRSQLPALLGLNAARESRMIIDMTQNLFFWQVPGITT